MSRLGEVARLFTKLGFTAFGGPAAHVALMEEETVHRRAWLDRQHFLDMMAAINFIPGPNSTQLAIHLGFLRAGYPGLIVAGVCFIVPAMLIIFPLAWLYVTYGRTPQVREALVGINACVVAIVAAALLRFVKTGIRDGFTLAVALVGIGIGFLAEPRVAGWCDSHFSAVSAVAGWLSRGRVELLILGAAAVLGAMWYGKPRMPTVAPMWLPLAVMDVSSPYFKMMVMFLKVGATLFGSGYVLVSYLQGGIVDQHGWMTQRQLLDAIAVGQVTPGPLLTTATFIGYFLGHVRFGGGIGGGIAGGLIATLAIFLPSFLLIAVLGPLLPKIRANGIARGALNGMNAAVVALIFVVCVRLGVAALFDGMTVGVAVLTLAAVLIWNVNSTWLIVGSGLLGAARMMLH
jgi:chromate transporter